MIVSDMKVSRVHGGTDRFINFSPYDYLYGNSENCTVLMYGNSTITCGFLYLRNNAKSISF